MYKCNATAIANIESQTQYREFDFDLILSLADKALPMAIKVHKDNEKYKKAVYESHKKSREEIDKKLKELEKTISEHEALPWYKRMFEVHPNYYSGHNSWKSPKGELLEEMMFLRHNFYIPDDSDGKDAKEINAIVKLTNNSKDSGQKTVLLDTDKYDLLCKYSSMESK